MPISRLTPLPALLIDWVITALWPLIGQWGLKHLSGIAFAQAGLCIGLLALAPALARQGRWRRLFQPGIRGPLLGMGFFGSALGTILLLSSLHYTTPGNAAIMAQSEVLYSALLAAWLLGESITRPQIAASLLILGGTSLVMIDGLSTPRWKGDLLALLTPWIFQFGHVLAKRLPRDLDACTLSGGRTFYGAVTLLPFFFWELWRGASISLGGEVLLAIAAQGLLMNSINLVLWYIAIRQIDLSKATAMLLSYPALTLLLSWALGFERVGWAQWTGFALTFGGAFWLSRQVGSAPAGPARLPALPAPLVQ
ncbi:MAG: DMT family transporter [Elusimicrobia bacterium]|nr:DMT family transporter [Elusimicrobiota bacterium]